MGIRIRVSRHGQAFGTPRDFGDAPAFISIGRDPSSDVVLPDDVRVSRHHAVLVRATTDSGHAYFIRDLSSASGTWMSSGIGDRPSWSSQCGVPSSNAWPGGSSQC